MNHHRTSYIYIHIYIVNIYIYHILYVICSMLYIKHYILYIIYYIFPVDRMSEIIPYIRRCQKYLLHCPAYSLRNDIHLWLLSGAHLWVSPPLTTHQSQFQIFIFHTFRLPPVSTKANHPSAQDSQLQHPSMYTSTEPFYKAYAMQSLSTKQWYLRQLYRSHRMNQASTWNAWDVLRLKEGHYSREDPSKNHPFR